MRVTSGGMAILVVAAAIFGSAIDASGSDPVEASPPYADASSSTYCSASTGCPGLAASADRTSGRLQVDAVGEPGAVHPGSPVHEAGCYVGFGYPSCDPQVPDPEAVASSEDAVEAYAAASVTAEVPRIDAPQVAYDITYSVSSGTAEGEDLTDLILQIGVRSRWDTLPLAAPGAPATTGTHTYRFAAEDPAETTMTVQLSGHARNGRSAGVVTIERIVALSTATPSPSPSVEPERTPGPEPSATPATLEAAISGRRVTLSWSGLEGDDVVVWRNGSPIVTTSNDGDHVDPLRRKQRGRFIYEVCAADACTNAVVIRR